VENVWQLALSTGGDWFFGGMGVGIASAIVGKQAGDHERGRLFGILGVMISLGSLLGGLTFGKMVDLWGYAGMSNSASLWSAITPVAALLLVDDGKEARVSERIPAREVRKVPGAARWVSAAFVLLILAEVIGNSATGPGNMGRSLSMSEKSFSNAAITVTMAVGGLISMPFPFLLGRLSDAVGRKSIMIASFLAGTASLLLLIVSRSLWQFWAVAALMSVNAVSTTIGPAYVADVVRKERVGTGISLFQSAAWIGTIIGLVYSGIAFQRLGMPAGLAVGAAFPVLGILILVFVRTTGGHVPMALPCDG
jgi:MFS family permease